MIRNFLIAICFALSSVPAARATILFTLGNNPQPGEENILLTSGDTGASLTGTTNSTALDVLFTSQQTLVVPSAGTSITGDGVPLTSISIGMANGRTSTDYILNPSIALTCAGCGGTANVSVTAFLNGTLEGTFSFLYTLGNGNNFLTIVGMDGETIASITINAPSGFTSLSSLRISGPYTAGNNTAPEPSTFALLALGVGGLALVRRRAC